MFLATTGIEEFWDKKEDILFLGPWCTPLARKESWGKLKGERAPDPWADRKDLHHACIDAQGLYEELLETLSRRLNEIHRLKRPVRYWRILIGPWLFRFIHFVYDRHVRLSLAFDSRPGLESTLLAEGSFVTPRDIGHFQSLGFDDPYNLQIISQIMLAQGRRFPVKPLDILPRLPVHELQTARFGALRGVFQGVTNVWGPKIIICGLFSRRSDQYRLIARLAGSAGQFFGRLPACPKPDLSLRHRKLAGIKSRHPVGKTIVALLGRNFPIRYLEGFQEARRAAVSGWKRPPKVIASSTGWLFDEALKFTAAEFSLSGTKLVGSQHGGNYGVDLHTPTEDVERGICDRFISWGWSDKGPGAPVQALPNPHPVRFQKAGLRRGQRQGFRLYFVTNGVVLYPYLLFSMPIGYQVEENIEDQGRFIAALKGRAARELIVRCLAIHERVWSQKERLRKHRSPLRFDPPSSTFEEGLGSARLLVLDSLSTTFLEALAYGVPCLVFLSPRFHRVRPSAARDMAILKDAGILFDDPAKAARRANELFEDPLGWWRSEPVVRARQRWLERHVGAQGPWLGPWADLLRESCD